MAIRASAEDYLETILLLTRSSDAVRSIDIVAEMGFSKPSVSVAMKKLREGDYIKMDDDGHITLTPKGQAVAAQVYDRHLTLYNWLVSLGVSDDIAAADACRMEHILHDESFEAIKRNNAASDVSKNFESENFDSENFDSENFDSENFNCPYFGNAVCGNFTLEKLIQTKREEAAQMREEVTQ
jgi:Mn-dependent DtxR family transcriptional regulator